MFFSILWISFLLGVTMLPVGCGSKDGDHSKEAESEHGEEESPSGASFKPGKGIILNEPSVVAVARGQNKILAVGF